jgi:hypothetical protein
VTEAECQAWQVSLEPMLVQWRAWALRYRARGAQHRDIDHVIHRLNRDWERQGVDILSERHILFVGLLRGW